MTLLAESTWLLAEYGWREELATFRQSQVGNPIPLGYQIALIVMCVAAIFAFFGIWARWRQRERGARQQIDDAYLRQAATVLSLSRQAVSDLRRIARSAGVSQPVVLLLSPANLSFAVRAAQQESADAALQARLASLCQELFGVGLDGAAGGGPPSAPRARPS
jgi:uncharacterized iron-regulated membrane protein